MKKKFALLSLLMVGATALTGCEYNFKYDVKPYPIEEPTKPTNILPTDIYLSNTKKSMSVGETFNLFATLAPNDVTNKTIKWSTSNIDIVSVNDGELTAIGEGTAIVTATSEADDKITASCEVSVKTPQIRVKDLSLTSYDVTLKIGATSEIYAVITPEDATNKNITWSSSNEDIVTVEEGKLTAKSVGQALITVCTEDGNKIKTCKVNVTSEAGIIVLPQSIVFSDFEASLVTGDSFQIRAKVLPEDTSDTTLKWSSSNPSVAFVTDGGLVYGISDGYAIITARSNVSDNIYATCAVSVETPFTPVEDLELSNSNYTLKLGQSFTIYPSVTPEDATNKRILWSSTDSSVASVSDGTVTANSSGVVIIKATTADGGISRTCNVYVDATEETEEVLPTSISLNLADKTIRSNETFQLIPTISPIDATNKTIEWSSSNEEVCTVAASGMVTSISEGTAIITATSKADSNVTATCKVTVSSSTIHVEALSLDPESKTMKKGSTDVIYPVFTPSNASNKNLTWSSSDSSIVTVNNGTISALEVGSAQISAVSEDGNITAKCTVTVKNESIDPTKLTLDTTIKSLSIGNTFQLLPTIEPDNATDKSITWTTSNSQVATVAGGKVTAVGDGSAIITATANGNKEVTATCTVNVSSSSVKVMSVSLSDKSKTLNVGDSFQLTATIAPSNAENQNVTWSSSKPEVATVENGVVKAISPGSSIIKVVTEDQGKTAACSVTVKSAGGSADPGFEETGVSDAGTYNIKIWCDERIKDLMQTQVENFQAHFGNKYTINLKIDDVSEGDAASMMTEDVGSGADIYVFAQDQLSKLKTAGALTSITGDIGKAVKSETETDGIAAATIDNSASSTMWAYPFTSDNGYFLYYDKKYISDEDAKSMETIIKKCEDNNLKINYGVFGNGFYSASYFMSTGCYSNWSMDASNKFCDYDDTYNSQNGFIAAKGIQYLAKHNIFAVSDDPSKFGRDKGGIGACVTGIWNYEYAKNAFTKAGDVSRLGCAQMPSFTVDGKSYHISSFSGYKLIGVKPQEDAKKVSVCKRLARYLSAETCQMERFEQVGWGPTNINALGTDSVKNHPGLKALRDQQPYSKPQVQCPSSWYGSVAALAASIKFDSTDSDIWAQLQAYYDNLESLLND